MSTRAPTPPATDLNLPATNILGVRIDRISLKSTMALIEEACEAGIKTQIATVNLNFITLARGSEILFDTINNCRLCVTDGRILLWVTQWLGEKAPEQITGHDLFREGLALAAERGYRVFLLGGPPGTAMEVSEKMMRKHPGLEITGTDHGKFSTDGEAEHPEELRREINAFRPHLLFVALGCPKQELWISKNLDRLDVSVAVGVGCVFDVVNGNMSRAPKWAQVAGLESVYQVITEPRRYGKRYFVDDPPTLIRVFDQVLRQRLPSAFAPRQRSREGQ